MTLIGWAQIFLFCIIIVALTPVIGGYMTRVFAGERTFLSPILRPVEIGLYRLGGVEEKHEQHWLTYTVAMILFHVGGFIFLYALIRLQSVLPFNPAGQSAVAPDLTFNTVISFITNTNWQNYGGESTMSYLVQMLGLTHQNFLSAATGIALALALIRGFSRTSMQTVGNFWVDITRCTLYVLLPICVLFTLFLVWQGIPQTLGPYIEATTLEGAKQTIAVGPVASQVAIKMLGTNGGGFFNANAAHPFENPTALSNFIQMLSIFVIGAAMTNVFGRMVGNQRQGWAILAAMGMLFIAGVVGLLLGRSERDDIASFARSDRREHGRQGSPLRHRGFGSVCCCHDGGFMRRGQRDARFVHGARWHDSADQHGAWRDRRWRRRRRPLRHAAVRHRHGVCRGLMVGRTPEYVGKKIEAREVKMAMLAILILPLMMLGWTAIAVVYEPAVASMGNAGPHGFSEVLYAFTSQAANNGSAFGV
jgi:K+-transporting ATPase ATPase A chain